MRRFIFSTRPSILGHFLLRWCMWTCYPSKCQLPCLDTKGQGCRFFFPFPVSLCSFPSLVPRLSSHIISWFDSNQSEKRVLPNISRPGGQRCAEGAASLKCGGTLTPVCLEMSSHLTSDGSRLPRQTLFPQADRIVFFHYFVFSVHRAMPSVNHMAGTGGLL